MCSVAVVVAFFICWAPFHTQRLMSASANSAAAAAAAETELANSTATTHADDEEPTEAQDVFDLVFFYVSGVLYYVSSVINPILYNIMSVKFRQAFVDTILRCNCRRGRRGRGGLAASALTLAGVDGAGTVAVRRYRFAAAGGAGQRSLEPGSSDAGSQRQRGAEENGPEEIQPLASSSLDNGRQVRQHHAADTIVMVECRHACRGQSDQYHI